MGVYSRKLQKYNLLKDFRVSNGTTWKLSRSLVFWLRANSSTNLLVDQSNNLSPIASTGTGHLDTTKGPLARFNFNGLNFNTKYITVSNGEAADSTDSKSIVFSWEDLDKYQDIMAMLNKYIDDNSSVSTNEEALERLLNLNQGM